jgi:hypothetical protein
MVEQVLKEDIFISYIGFLNNVAEKGKLFLYKDKIVWTGSSIINIPINRIVSVKLDLSKKHLIISIDDKHDNKKKYTFTTPSFMNSSVRYKKQMESWRDTINNVCSGIFQLEQIEYIDNPVEYCSNCGKRLKCGMNFCSGCGHKIV